MSHVVRRAWSCLCAILVLAIPVLAQSPLRVFLRGGPKTHGPGEHDHPAFVEDWTRLLRERGAAVEGALNFPSAEQLARTDVLVLYAAEGGSIHGADRANLEAYLARGGGIVALHDAVCGDDPQWFKTVIGGAWEHGRARWATGPTDMYVRDPAHPITAGASNWRFDDELYTELHLQPDIHVLMAGFHDVFSITPQMWTYEPGTYRAFVSIQGHYKKSFEHDAWRTLLLRGIAWAGGRDADSWIRESEREALAYPTGGPTRPERSGARLVPHEGFRVDLMAAEPLIVNPISLDWDERGRLWVAETPGYPFKQESSGIQARDTISVLEDTDGDGRFDAKRLFAGGLDLVTSLVPHGDGVIALMAPDIVWLRDRDGDGQSDARELLFTGFGYGDTHAVISNARWGVDGWIYATQGYSGGASTNVRNLGPDKDGAARERGFGRIGNGLFRFRPDGSAIEMVSSYGSNTWGLDFSEDGELFFTMANGAHLRHVVTPEKSLSRARFGKLETWRDLPDHDRVVPLSVHEEEAYRQIDFIGGFTAASGCAIYDGGAWPREYDGAHFVAEPTVNLVHEDRLAPAGSSFVATKSRDAEFLASEDLWFRPVHMRVGPEGAMYVLDFYNQAAVHNDTRGPEHGPTNAAVRPDRDTRHGRIWRVQHANAIDVSGPALDARDATRLIAALESPNGWRRNSALRLICADPRLDIADRLRETARNSKRPSARIAAWWALARRGELSAAQLEAAFVDAAPAVRRNAGLISTELGLGSALRAKLVACLNDTDDRVRVAALAALGQAQLDNQAFAELAKQFVAGRDPYLRALALEAAAQRPLEAIRSVLYARAAPGTVDYAVELASVLARSGGIEDAAELVCLMAEKGPPATSRRVLERLARDSKAKGVPQPSTRLQAALASLIGSPDFDLASVALGFASAWDANGALAKDVSALGDRLERAAADPTGAADQRLSCLRSLLTMPQRRARALELGSALFAPTIPGEVQLAWIDALGREGDDAIGAILARAYVALGAPAREQAFARIVRRARWVEPLLVELEAQRLVPNDLGPLRLSQLENHADPGVATRAKSVLEKIRGPAAKQTEELIARILPIVESPGDAAKGAELFAANCATCHVYRGKGAHIGPDLTGMGAHGARALLPVILDPNASVEAAYLEYVCVTTDDRLVTGILVRDTPEGIVLRSTSGDAEVPRDEIASLRSTGRSPMPMGLESIGPEGLRDVLAFLSDEYAGYRVLDLRNLANMSSRKGMYDPERAPDVMDLLRYGVFTVDGVPYEIRDPLVAEGGRNVICLRGGMQPDWFSRTGLPKTVRVPVGFALERMHVLGGIAAWGHPIRDDRQPAVRWTWVYADGQREPVVLHDGVEFADWIGRRDVPGSKYVEDLVRPGSFGQLRTFSLAPLRTDAVVVEIELESFDNHLSPTFVGLTAELAGAERLRDESAREPVEPLDVLVFGGGSSHDYSRWFDAHDLGLLRAKGVARSAYSERTSRMAAQLEQVGVLVLTNNQPLASDGLRDALERFLERGSGLVIVHPATWYNWSDWPAYNTRFVGGGARGHEAYGEFDVEIVDPAHAIGAGVPAKFAIQDELYQTSFENPANVHVIATGRSRSSGKVYPVVWTVSRAKGRTACLTLGHDGAAHEHAAYAALYTNAVRWAKGD